MTSTPKTSYHPYLLIAFYLDCLPDEWMQRIPRSTRHDWKHKNFSQLYGYDWYMQNRHLFDTLQQVSASKRLLQVNRALLKVIALQRFIRQYAFRIQKNILNTRAVVLAHICKITRVMGLQTTLKYLQVSYNWYLQVRKKLRCHSSPLELCYLKHPTQLLKREVCIIKSYCTDTRFLHWPLASVYHQLIRDKAAAFTISTFYKYISILNLQRLSAARRRKNHHTGVRAQAPLQIIHADNTLYTTADNCKSHIYLVQDNYSRAILQHAVNRKREAQITFNNLTKVYEKYLQPAGIESCELITDDGVENYGEVKGLISSSTSPVIKHLIAQVDIAFSNSMIEAANKQLKYRFLYHRHIADFDELVKYVQQAVDDYNNRPHDVLSGLTPMEVLNGKTYDEAVLSQQIIAAKAARMIENRMMKCCHYSF